MDMKAIESEVRKELLEEKVKNAKVRLKAKLQQIHTAESVLDNLKREYKDLLSTIEEGN